jgi:hypothetical protein
MEGTTMTFLRTSQKQISRRDHSARSIRPVVEGCESRQLMSGAQAAVYLTSFCKMAPVAISAEAGETMSPTALADLESKMIKH